LAKARGEMGNGEEKALLASSWRVAGIRPTKGRHTWAASDGSGPWRLSSGDNQVERPVGGFEHWRVL
jgi:hypothetical protein